MLENEDSVVTSLNELRKLKHERITRQTQSRAVIGTGRAAALAVDPASDQLTPPPAQVPQGAQTRQSAQYAQASASGSMAAFPDLATGGFSPASAAYNVASPVPVIQVRTSYKAAVFMTVLLAGAAGAGYFKLQNDMQAQLALKDDALKKAEEERLLAAGTAAKTEAQSRSNLRQCEDKLKALAAAPAPSAAPALAAPSAPAVEKKPEKTSAPKVAARAAKSKPAARPSRRAQAAAEPAPSKTADVPTIAKKKKLDNDPLSGLGKL
jgi:hypothetical protein